MRPRNIYTVVFQPQNPLVESVTVGIVIMEPKDDLYLEDLVVDLDPTTGVGEIGVTEDPIRKLFL